MDSMNRSLPEITGPDSDLNPTQLKAAVAFDPYHGAKGTGSLSVVL